VKPCGATGDSARSHPRISCPPHDHACANPTFVFFGRFVLYGAFDYYALEGVINDMSGSDADIYSISFNAFHRFCTEMRWECDECPSSHFDIIFTQVSATCSLQDVWLS
jgi:hypothetical protein